MVFWYDINVKDNEIKNVRVDVVSSLPATAQQGRVVYYTTDNFIYYYDGSEWVPVEGLTTQKVISLISASCAVTTTSQAISSGTTITSIPIADATTEFTFYKGNIIRLLHPDTFQYQEFTVSTDSLFGDTYIQIYTAVTSIDFPIGSIVIQQPKQALEFNNHGYRFNQLFEFDETLENWVEVSDVELKTDPNVGNATAGILFDSNGIKLYDTIGEVVSINSTGSWAAKYYHLTESGSPSDCAIRLDSNTSTGINIYSNDTIELVCLGSAVAQFSDTALTLYKPLSSNSSATLDSLTINNNSYFNKSIYLYQGTTVLPSLAFTADPYTGINQASAGSIDILISSQIKMSVSSSSIDVQETLSINNGKVSFSDSSSDPTSSGQLNRNNTKLVWHNGTIASPLATEEWVNSYGKKVYTITIKQYTQSWVDGEVLFVWRAPSWAAGLRYNNFIVSCATADTANDWSIVFQSANASGVSATLSAGSTQVDLGIAPLVSSGELVTITTNRVSGSSGAPEGLNISFVLIENTL